MPLEVLPTSPIATSGPQGAPPDGAPGSPAGASGASGGATGPAGDEKPAEGGTGPAIAKPEDAPEGKKAEKDPKDPPAEDEKLPATEKETAYGRSVRKREVELVARQERFARERADVQAKASTLDSREKAVTDRETKLAAREAELEEDPLAYATKHKGYKDEDLARRFITGQVSPQEQQRRKDEASKGELGELRTMLSDLTKKLEAKDTAQAEATKAAAMQQANERVLADFTAHAKACTTAPLAAKAIAELGKDAVDECNVIAAKMRADHERDDLKGPGFWDVVLAKFNDRLTKIAAAVGSPPKEPESPGSQVKRPEEKAPTLTSKGSSQRSSKIDPKDDPNLRAIDPEAANQKALKAAADARAAHEKRAAART